LATRALEGRIDGPWIVLAQGLEACARAPGILGASAVIGRVERSVPSIRSEVRSVPNGWQPEHPRSNTHFAGWGVALEKTRLFETFDNPEGEIAIDAERIENLALKLVRESFAWQQMVVFW
jgi:hypothetical protein